MADKTKYSTMSVEDLENRLNQTQEELDSARLKHRIGQFKKTSEFSRLRKEVARIRTYIRQKQQVA